MCQVIGNEKAGNIIASEIGVLYYAFTGRKDSADGTQYLVDALRAFSIRSLVASKLNDFNTNVAAIPNQLFVNSGQFAFQVFRLLLQHRSVPLVEGEPQRLINRLKLPVLDLAIASEVFTAR